MTILYSMLLSVLVSGLISLETVLVLKTYFPRGSVKFPLMTILYSILLLVLVAGLISLENDCST